MRRLIKGSLIVSCQAEKGEPLFGSETMAKMALAAVQAGAKGIRANGPQDVAAIKKVVNVPIIGIQKDRSASGAFITIRRKDIDSLVKAGADLIAIDSTRRSRPESLEALFRHIRRNYPDVGIVADVADIEDAIKVAKLRPDYISTALSGYTDYTLERPKPDIELVKVISEELKIPVLAEGNYKTPELVRLALLNGAYAVVVGTYITRPQVITSDFVKAVKDFEGKEIRAIGIDIGGTNVRMVEVDLKGEILRKEKRKNPKELKSLLEFIEEFISNSNDVTHLGVAIGGMVNSTLGFVRFLTPILGDLKELNIAEIFERNFGIRPYVENDVNAAAYAQWWKTKEKVLLLIHVGTGVGGALLVDGKPIKGKSGGAAELGHVIVPGNKKKCLCGKVGCTETLLSGEALLQAIKTQGREKAFEEYGFYMAWLIDSAKAFYEFERAYIGGVVKSYGEELLEIVREVYCSLSRRNMSEEIAFYEEDEFGGAKGSALMALRWGGITH